MKNHIHRPERYSLFFSSREEPVLRINSGDTVETTSIDSQGDDENGKCAGPKYNALTGPFYVEEAQPGDVLKVHLERVRLNGRTGLSYSGLNDHATTPREFARSLEGARLYHWRFNFDDQTASADLTPRLGRLKLPLRPFPGCIGVAPPEGESLSALFAGSHGGNIDYNGLVEGTTLHFPVSAPGAHFFFGDGHAAQGDGESNGGAVEATLAVKFRVEVVAQGQIPSLRAESADSLMALGVGEPLDRAYQRASANMIDWLTRGFGLELHEAYVLIGATARFDIASIVNGRGNTVACRISRGQLHQLLDGAAR